MAGPANAERFVNYITGDPIALADTNASSFGPGYPGLVPAASDPVDPTKFLSEAGWAVPPAPAVTGRLIQNSFTTYATWATTTAVIPFDDTIPQIGEGTGFFSVAFTPISATSLLTITVKVHGVVDATDNWAAALFKDAIADALAAEWAACPGGFPSELSFIYQEISGSTTARTYSVRAGMRGLAASNFYINGGTGTRFFGGVSVCSILVQEFSQ